MHHRKGRCDRNTVEKQASFQAPCDGEDHGKHHDQSRIEEDGEAEDERRDAKRHGRALFAEPSDEIVGKRLGATGYFKQPAQHCAKTDQKCHPAKG